MSDNSSLRQATAKEETRLAWLEKERAGALAKLQELKDRLAVEESAPTSPMPVPSDEAPSRSGYLPPDDRIGTSSRVVISGYMRTSVRTAFPACSY